MDKTIAYYIERYLGILAGLAVLVLVYLNWFDGSTLLKEKYYDMIIKVSSSIFGFLLTILALIVNSSSKAVAEMREHKSYPRLIKYNRAAVFLSFIIILVSILIYLIITPEEGIKCFSDRYSSYSFKILISIHAGLCIWSIVDTGIFVRIFYRIILMKSN